MQLLQRQYIDRKIQQHLKELHLPQTGKKLTRKELLEALKAKGAIQPEEAPEEENVFHWPFRKAKPETSTGSTPEADAEGGDKDCGSEDDGIIFLRHCNLRTSYMYSGRKWEKRQMCVTLGLLATFICEKEKPETLAEEIHRIDTQLIPQWIKDFDDLQPDEITQLATDEFAAQIEIIRKQPVILDTLAASIFAVTVTEVRQAISRNKNLFTEEAAFHLSLEEMRERARKYINPPKVRKSDYRPYALTQQGFLLLSMHLNSSIAVKMHICIIQTVSARIPFTEMLQKMLNTRE